MNMILYTAAAQDDRFVIGSDTSHVSVQFVGPCLIDKLGSKFGAEDRVQKNSMERRRHMVIRAIDETYKLIVDDQIVRHLARVGCHWDATRCDHLVAGTVLRVKRL